MTKGSNEFLGSYGGIGSSFNKRLSASSRILFAKAFINLMASPLSTQKEANKTISDGITMVFALGGPGSGKGTQCRKIAEHFGFTHLCAGDLLEAEVQSGSENGIMIRNFKIQGKIVPSEITTKLLQQAMQQSENKKFIIDGFPRNEENRAAFENNVKIQPECVLFLECPEEVLIKRLLNRGQGRVDDNIDTIRKRLKVYSESTLPVINYYSSKGKVQKIDAERSVDEVFEDVSSVLSKLKLGNRAGSLNQ